MGTDEPTRATTFLFSTRSRTAAAERDESEPSSTWNSLTGWQAMPPRELMSETHTCIPVRAGSSTLLTIPEKPPTWPMRIGDPALVQPLGAGMPGAEAAAVEPAGADVVPAPVRAPAAPGEVGAAPAPVPDDPGAVADRPAVVAREVAAPAPVLEDPAEPRATEPAAPTAPPAAAAAGSPGIAPPPAPGSEGGGGPPKAPRAAAGGAGRWASAGGVARPPTRGPPPGWGRSGV